MNTKVVPTSIEMSTRYVDECGTDIGPDCILCAGTIWHYRRAHVEMNGAFLVTAKCMGCYRTESFPAPRIDSAQQIRQTHEISRMKLPVSRQANFMDGTAAETRLSDETIAKQHGWEMVRDSLRNETVFIGWRLEAIECSDGEMVHERFTAAISGRHFVNFYSI